MGYAPQFLLLAIIGAQTVKVNEKECVFIISFLAIIIRPHRSWSTARKVNIATGGFLLDLLCPVTMRGFSQQPVAEA
ncbi:MAG: hypothetical protein AAF965_13205, partial [Pseudomonadota bacterium]